MHPKVKGKEAPKSQNLNELWFRLRKKIQAIKRVENREKLFAVATSYGVSSNTVGDWH